MASATSEIAKVSWLREAQHESGPGLPGDRAEYFVTRILPGLKEGHEVLTRRAAAAVPGVDTPALLRGVVRVDAGKHIWNLPGALASSLDPSQQRRHALRAAPCQSTGAAVGAMRALLTFMHGRARTAASRAQAFEMAGEFLHLLQDSYSLAHVLRAFRRGGAPHPIRYVRFFGFLSKLPPRRTTAPNEHQFVSDPRDEVFDSAGGLKFEASIAVDASVEYLRMLIAQRSRPPSPRDATELLAFLNRHFVTGSVIHPGAFHPACGLPPAPVPAPHRIPVAPPIPRPSPPPPAPSRLRRLTALEQFAFDRSDLTLLHGRQIAGVARAIVASRRTPRPIRSVVLVGHTDSAGRPSYNVGLGLRRAAAVARALRLAVARLSPVVARSLRIVTRSGGEARPAVSNATPAGRARNRRVVVFVSSSILAR